MRIRRPTARDPASEFQVYALIGATLVILLAGVTVAATRGPAAAEQVKVAEEPEPDTTATVEANLPKNQAPTEPTPPPLRTWLLGPEGLGRYTFRASAATVIADLRRDFGEPTSDTGRVQLNEYDNPVRGPRYCDQPDCLGLGWDRPAYREVCFEMLCVVADPDLDEFVGWNMRVWTASGYEYGSDPVPGSPDVRTAEGITVGSSFEQLQAAYPHVTLHAGEGASVAYDIGWRPLPPYDGAHSGTGGLSAQVDWSSGAAEINPEGSWVQSIAAGDGPSAGCC